MQTFDSIMAAKSERRRKERKRPLSLVYVEFAAGNGGMIRDLSEEGFAVRSMMALRNGEKTSFRFSLDEATSIAGAGQICWVKDDGKLAGVRFEEISPEALDHIREWLLKGGRLSKAEPKTARVPERAAPTLEDFREELRSIPAHPRAHAAKKPSSPSAPAAASTPEIPASGPPPAKMGGAPVMPVIPSPPVSLPSSVVAVAEPAPAEDTTSVSAPPAVSPPTVSPQRSLVAEAEPVPAEQPESVPAKPAVTPPHVISGSSTQVPVSPVPAARTEVAPAAPAIPAPAEPTGSVWNKLMLPTSPSGSERAIMAPAVPAPPTVPPPTVIPQRSLVAEAELVPAEQTESVPAKPAVTPPDVISERSAQVPVSPVPAARTEIASAAPAIPPPAEPTGSVWNKLMLPTSSVSSERAVVAPAVPAPQGKEQDAHALPDISTILLQPTMVRKISEPMESLPELPALEPLPPLKEEISARREPRMESFTLARAVGIMLVLALLVSAYVYRRQVGLALIWVGQKIAGTDLPADRKTSAVENPAPSSAPAQLPQTSGGAANEADTTSPNYPSGPMILEPKNATTAGSAENMPQVSSAQANGNPLMLGAPLAGSTRVAQGTSPDQETGQAEYQQALQLLRGKNREANMQEAVRLLWAAVEKGNPGAELTLAELFWRGQGVAKSCDQARILLSAAARKGDPEARDRLKQFEQEGCE